jgi:hypothetical protein
MSEHEHNDDKRKFVVDTLSEKVKLLGHWFKFKRSTCAKVQSVINDPDDAETLSTFTTNRVKPAPAVTS